MPVLGTSKLRSLTAVTSPFEDHRDVLKTFLRLRTEMATSSGTVSCTSGAFFQKAYQGRELGYLAS